MWWQGRLHPPTSSPTPPGSSPSPASGPMNPHSLVSQSSILSRLSSSWTWLKRPTAHVNFYNSKIRLTKHSASTRRPRRCALRSSGNVEVERPGQGHICIGGSSMASTTERAMAAGARHPRGTHAGRTVVSDRKVDRVRRVAKDVCSEILPDRGRRADSSQ